MEDTSPGSCMMEFVTESMVRGYHIYQDVWTPVMGEHLQCVREEDNAEDRYAVAVTKDGVTVGHLPRRISTLASLFIRRGGIIRCSVTGNRRYSRDLAQGGMEIPCQLTFIGMGKELKKVRCNFARDLWKKAAVTPVTINKTLGESSCSTCADKTHKSSCTSASKKCIVKEEPIDTVAIDIRKDIIDLDVTNIANITDNVWITHGNHTLKLSDKVAIERDEELTDKHMQMAQHLVKIQFPVIGGLESTLLQQKNKKGTWTMNTVQIIYCNKRSHWITATTKFCKLGQVNIYDSMFSKLDVETRTTVKQMFGLKKADDINVVAMQCQKGSKDCGLFAIAVMTSLAFGEDPSTVSYDQDKLRRHLIDCITKGELSLFPKIPY